MKKISQYGIAIAGILAAATLGVSAEDDKERKDRPGPRPGGPRKPPKELLEKYDKDGSGDLDREERAAVRADLKKRREAILAKYDANEDGKLDPEERKKMVLDRFDKDEDGVLSDEEKKAARAAMRRGPRGGADRRGPGGRRRGGDRDGDGDRPRRKPEADKE